MVVGDLAEVTVTQEIGAGISHVHDRDTCRVTIGQPVERRGGGAHAGKVGVVRDHLADARTRLIDSRREPGEGLALIEDILGQVSESRHGGRARQLPRRVATHAVGDDKQAGTGVPGVFVALADLSDIGAGGVAQREGHGYLCNCSVVRPMRRGTLGGRMVGEVMRLRSTQVPLVDPRSSTIHPSSPG